MSADRRHRSGSPSLLWPALWLALFAVALAVTRDVVLAVALALAGGALLLLARRAIRDALTAAAATILAIGALLAYAGLAECDRSDCGATEVLYWLSPLGLALVATAVVLLAIALTRRR